MEQLKLCETHKSEYFVLPIVAGSKLYLGYGQAKMSLVESVFFIFSDGATELDEETLIRSKFPSSFDTRNFKFVNMTDDYVLDYVLSLDSLHVVGKTPPKG